MRALFNELSVSFDNEVYEQVPHAAGPNGISGWLAKAATARLRREALLAVADEIAESTGGCCTERELAESRTWLPSSSSPAR